jgi:hypothetical protein
MRATSVFVVYEKRFDGVGSFAENPPIGGSNPYPERASWRPRPSEQAKQADVIRRAIGTYA